MYSKDGKIKLETSAQYVPIGKTNIVFYDSDINTADLVFTVTRNGHPLEISNENTECYLMLKASDGTYIVDNAYVEDPMNGRVRYTIPKEFLSHSGDVKGQVWIAVHGKEDIVTEVEFSFAIKENMFVNVPATDKVNYIRTFDELRERVNERVKFIEEALENGNDYVRQMEDTLISGMKSINDRSAEVVKQINDLADKHSQELDKQKDTSIQAVQTAADETKEDVKKWADETNQKIENADIYTKKETDSLLDKKANQDVVNTALDKKIDKDNFKVNDRNLLKNTSDEWQVVTFNGWGYGATSYYLSDLNLVAGDRITYSVYLNNTLTDTDVKIKSDLDIKNENGDTIERINGDYVDAGKSEQIILHATIPENAYRIAVVTFRKSDEITEITCAYRAKKLQKGDISSEWTPAPEDKLDANVFKNFVEHGYLELEKGFENYNDNSNVRLQYTRVGPLCHVFGTITNTNKLERSSEVIVASLPDRMKVITNETQVSQGTDKHTFTTQVRSAEDEDYSNQIFVSRFRNNSGESVDFVQGRWLNVSLTFTVEVVDNVQSYL